MVVGEKRRNGSWCIVSAVLLLLIACAVTTFVSSRYAGTANGSSQVTIACFDVTASESSSPALSVDLNNADTMAEYTFAVTSKSDVSVSYNVTVTLPAHTVSGLVLRINDQSKSVESGETTYTFENVGTLLYGEQTQNCTLVFDASSVTDDVSLDGISVTVTATQVD